MRALEYALATRMGPVARVYEEVTAFCRQNIQASTFSVLRFGLFDNKLAEKKKNVTIFEPTKIISKVYVSELQKVMTLSTSLLGLPQKRLRRVGVAGVRVCSCDPNGPRRKSI